MIIPKNRLKSINRTFHAATVASVYLILQVISMASFLVRYPTDAPDLLKTVITEYCIFSILYIIGNCAAFYENQVPIYGYHFCAGILHTCIVIDMIFSVGTGAKIHVEMWSFLIERLQSSTNSLQMMHVWSHFQHFFMFQGAFAILLAFGMTSAIYRFFSSIGILYDDKKMRNFPRTIMSLFALLMVITSSWNIYGCQRNGTSRLICETIHDRFHHIRYGGEVASMIANNKKRPRILSRVPVPAMTVKSISSKPKNVVVVGLESVRASATTPYSKVRLPHATPFLEELASEGVLINNAFASIAQTNKQLLSIFCGFEPNVKMTWSEWTSYPLEECLPNVLRQHAGYKTAVFTSGKKNNGLAGPGLSTPAALGFSESIGYTDIQNMYANKYEKISYLGFDDKATLEPLSAWLTKLNHSESPIMVGVFTIGSHSPYNVPKTFRSKHMSEDPLENKYLNSVRYVDSYLRSLFAVFKRHGINKDNSIFVIVGDHGQTFGKHNRYFHGSVHEDSTHVPLLFYGGLGTHQRQLRINGIRRTVDIAPSLFDLLEFPIFENKSPLGTGKSIFGPDHAFAPAFDFFDEAALAMVTMNNGVMMKVVAKVDEPIQKVQAVYRFGDDLNIVDQISPQMRDQWSCQLLSWRRHVHSLADGDSLNVARKKSSHCGQGAREKSNSRKLKDSKTICGACNNFGFKCTVTVGGSGGTTTTNGEYSEYPRKEPESGVCMWSKKCGNAQCVLRFVKATNRWEIISTQSSNKVAYYKVVQNSNHENVDLSGGWQQGQIGQAPPPTSVKFSCSRFDPPKTCDVCDVSIPLVDPGHSWLSLLLTISLYKILLDSLIFIDIAFNRSKLPEWCQCYATLPPASLSSRSKCDCFLFISKIS